MAKLEDNSVPMQNLGNRIVTVYNDLKQLEQDLRAVGDHPAAEAMTQAMRELNQPGVTGRLNKMTGVGNLGSFRR